MLSTFMIEAKIEPSTFQPVSPTLYQQLSCPPNDDYDDDDARQIDDIIAPIIYSVFVYSLVL
jgi:hypothetical protein